MLPKDAVIQSSKSPVARWKLFGQHLLERNIRLLHRAGVNRIYLDLSPKDAATYETSIARHVQSLKNLTLVTGKSKAKKQIVLSANQFLMFRAFSSFKKTFAFSEGNYTPLKSDDQYEIKSDPDFKKARSLALEVIRTGSGGKIAQNVNKRISLPLSRVFAHFRVSPNLITIVNFFVGAAAIALLFTESRINMAIGGILVQVCSVVDGCDGEVARMTTRFSKIGGILDSTSDQLLAVALVTVAMIKVHTIYPAEIFYLTLGVTLFGLLVIFATILVFMYRYSESMSLASFNREFIDVLPRTDILTQSMQYLQYLTRKELYSMLVCVFAVLGILQIYLFILAGTFLLGAFAILILSIRFFPTFKRIRG